MIPHQAQRQRGPKIYALHAPEVVCIAKGKAHRPYEFGSKIAVAGSNRGGFVLVSKALKGNPCDGHTLDATVHVVIQERREQVSGSSTRAAGVAG
jgi:transposase, IS5 family